MSKTRSTFAVEIKTQDETPLYSTQVSIKDGEAVGDEAKALGIRMGDPFFKIRNLVEKHGVAVFSGNMALYGDMSQRVRWVPMISTTL